MHVRNRRLLTVAAVALVSSAAASVLTIAYAVATDALLLLLAALLASIALALSGATAVVAVLRFRDRERSSSTRMRRLEEGLAVRAEAAALEAVAVRLAKLESSVAQRDAVDALEAELAAVQRQADDAGRAVQGATAWMSAQEARSVDVEERLVVVEALPPRLEELMALEPRVAATADGIATVEARLGKLERDPSRATTSAKLAKLEARLAASPSPEVTARAATVVDGLVSLAQRQGLELAAVVSQPLAAYRVAAAAERADVLAAIPYLDAHPGLVADLTNAQVRTLIREFRRTGYLSRAVPLVEEIARRMGKPRDIEVAEILASELALFEGKLAAPIALPPMEAELRSGVVLHLVGKVLPETQSGYTLRTQYTVEAQRRAGIEPVVVAHSGGGAVAVETTRTFEHGGVQHYELGGPERGRVPWDTWLRCNVEALAAVVREVRPAVLHVHSDFMNALIALPVAKAYGIPLVNETRGFWEESWLSRTASAEGWTDLDRLSATAGLPDMYQLRLEREAEARSSSDAVVTLARVMREHIVEVSERLGLPVPPIYIASNAVEPSSFERREPDVLLREELGIPETSTVVGYISSIVEYEGIDTLVRGFHALEVALRGDAAAEGDELATTASSLRGDVRLLIVGDGPELQPLVDLVAVLGSEKIVFAGRVPHERVDDYYALMDLFVVPRRRSAVTELVTPLKPFEAMAIGLPCLFSDVAALAEIAEDSGAAELFHAGDPRHLAVRLAEMLADPERLRSLGERGAAWVRAERTWDVNAETYVALYQTLGYPVARELEHEA